jgi:hypothetical protein
MGDTVRHRNRRPVRRVLGRVQRCWQMVAHTLSSDELRWSSRSSADALEHLLQPLPLLLQLRLLVTQLRFLRLQSH